MPAKGPLTVSLLTPEKVLFEGDADSVTVPGHDGELGILSRHVAMVARLGAGIARIHAQGQTTRTFVSGGFVQVAGNRVTILTDYAREPAEVDRGKAGQMLEEALGMEATDAKSQTEKARAVALARARLRVANQFARQ